MNIERTHELARFQEKSGIFIIHLLTICTAVFWGVWQRNKSKVCAVLGMLEALQAKHWLNVVQTR